MSVVRCAVIGVGHLGRFHAEKYSTLDCCELVALADPNPQNALKLSKEYECDFITNYKEILDKVDAVSIVVPTSLHYEVANKCLEAGIHVLLEKPITDNVDQAKLLDHLAQKKNVKFQIGHIERFNPAVLKFKEINYDEDKDEKFSINPVFITSTRIAPFKPRVIDVDVITDLMVHDIDLILHMVNSPIANISARGRKVLSNSTDIAYAYLEFENNCVANITASRVSERTQRTMNVFTENAYYAIDFQNRTLKSSKVLTDENPKLNSKYYNADSNDALKTEIESFIQSIISSIPVSVSAQDGIKTIETATLISVLIDEYNRQL
ncbi:MAG: UDP-N-acetyl-D-glucosamine dehydrogenase [Rickettsiales bacterium]|nr:UDP-N-acetyl-D-glucosamine dehydrogenase [Rickettsiales bacterium]OUW04480.1 MAG: hypothetical protein CBD16_02205 [Betaproteobacteria bacterium TMED156]